MEPPPLNPQSPAPPTPTPDTPTKDTRLGTVIRVAFFVATVFVAVRLPHVWPYIRSSGYWSAGTLGLGATGLLANLLTMKIFDRRPFTDIGLQTGRLSALNFVTGILFGGGAAALMLLAPLLAGTGHLVLRENSSFAWPSLLFFLAALWFAAAGEEMIFRGYAFQLLIEKMGPYATVLPVGVIFGLTQCRIRIRPRSCSSIPSCGASYSAMRFCAVTICGCRLACTLAGSGLAAVRSQPERAYNRCIEVRLPMGSFASLERRGLRSGGWAADHHFCRRSVFRASQSPGAHADRGHSASSQRALVALLLFGLVADRPG